ncbi:MAG TPA: hypothetical protein VGC89_06525 [Pyrinomonadaceae bacterium]|jgi:hypothetical protein
MTTTDKRARFPKTNQEYFRLVLKNGLIFSAIVLLLIVVGGKALAPSRRWHAEDWAKACAVSLLIGFNLTLLRLRWLKDRD